MYLCIYLKLCIAISTEAFLYTAPLFIDIYKHIRFFEPIPKYTRNYKTGPFYFYIRSTCCSFSRLIHNILCHLLSWLQVWHGKVLPNQWRSTPLCPSLPPKFCHLRYSPEHAPCFSLSLSHTSDLTHTHTHNGLRHNKFSGKGFYTSKSPFNLHMRTHTAGNRLVFIKQPA